MIDQQIQALQAKISRKTELEEQLPRLKAELPAMRQQVLTLRLAMLEEQSDVDRLESGGIGTVFHKLTGRMEEKLDKERLEAQNASEEYQAAAARLEEAEAALTSGEIELEALQSCEAEYSQVMLSRIRELEAMAEDPAMQEQAETIKLRLQLERRRKSLREALLESGAAARASAKNLDALQNAREQARKAAAPDDCHTTVPNQQDDLIEADKYAQLLLEEMTDLQAKLAQMGIDPEPHISIGPYLKAPTAYIVGAASDSAPLDQITKAIHQVEDLQNQITSIEQKLTEALGQIESRLEQF